MPSTIFLADKVFTGNEWLTDSAIRVNEGTISGIIPAEDIAENMAVQKYPGCFIAPAFIDLQLYGAGGLLLAEYPTAEAVSAIYEYSRNGGAALCLPTVATNTKEVFFKSIDAVKAYWDGGGKGVWGLHLEGPWINIGKRGAHVSECIHSPSLAEVKEMLAYGKGVIKMITLAPEVCSREVNEYIQSEGIVISAGHSNISFEEAMANFDQGIPAITHLYNAMSPLQHRSPGLVGAAFLHPKVKASIIADGYHVDFTALKIAKQVMKERLFVITDAVTDAGTGYYQHQKAGDKYECNGVLSGSALTMHQSFINLVQKAGIETEEALRMCSLYPAEVIGAERYGKIAPGGAAQFVVLNKQLAIVETITC